MKPRVFSSKAIVLSKKKYSETDRIVTVLSKDYGKITFIAKGIRLTKSRKRGSIEVFAEIKFQAARGKDMDIISEVETVNSFNDIRTNLKKTALAYYFLELTEKMSQPDEKNPELYNLVLDYLQKLTEEKRLKSLRGKFVYELIVLMGFWERGVKVHDIDNLLDEILEKEVFSKRVGKLIQS